MHSVSMIRGTGKVMASLDFQCISCGKGNEAKKIKNQ